MITTVVWGIHIAVCIFLILIVLLQQGKGADMGAAFGGGSNTLFGAGGADSILTRVTTITAAIFMVTAVFLAKTRELTSSTDSSLFKDVAPVTAAPAALPAEKDNKTAPTATTPGENKTESAPSSKTEALPSAGADTAAAGTAETSAPAVKDTTDSASAAPKTETTGEEQSLPATP